VPSWVRWVVFAAFVTLVLSVSVNTELQQAKIYNQSQPSETNGTDKQSSQMAPTLAAEIIPGKGNQESHWYYHITDWLLVLFNGILAAFTVRLFYAAAEQSRDMKASVAAARQSAYAAEIAAQAAQTTAKTQIGAERAWFLLIIDEENFEDVLESRLNPDVWPAAIRKPEPQVKFHFENFGKSPAFVKEIATDIRNWPELPSRLTYTPNIPWNEEIVVPAGGRIPDGRDEQGEWRLFRHTLAGTVDVDAAKLIDDGKSHFWFYGQVIYDDIWGNEHATRFCWGHDGRLSWFLPENSKRYNDRT
jgi:hypothetical protein